jgi:hypothetical protein
VSERGKVVYVPRFKWPVHSVVSSLHVTSRHAHDRVQVFSGGQYAGELILNPGDGQAFAEHLSMKPADDDDKHERAAAEFREDCF